MTLRAEWGHDVGAGALAGAAIGALAVGGHGPVPAWLATVALWVLCGGAVGIATTVVRRGACALDRWYFPLGRSSGLMVLAGVLGFAALPAILELGMRPWAQRLGIGTARVVLAGLGVGGAAALAMAVASEARRFRFLVAGCALVVAAFAPAAATLPLPVTRATLVVGLVVAVAGGVRSLFQDRVQWASLLVVPALVCFLFVSPYRVPDRDHPLSLTLRALLPDPAGDGPGAAALARHGETFGRTRSGSQVELDKFAPGRRQFNVLWITLCTFRGDRVGALGGPEGVTPFLDSFARTAWVFERAWTPYPMTVPSTRAMFSGVYPSNGTREQGARGGVTLPELFQEGGRSTWAFTSFGSLGHASEFRALGDGFDLFDLGREKARVPGALPVAAFGGQIESAGDRPWLAWLFLMDAHGPYTGDPERGDETTEEARYLGGMRVADRAVGRALALLEESGLSDRTIVVIHGDHGEALEEHGSRWHGTDLFEEQVHVPLMVRVPGIPAGRTQVPVDLTDLAPTVAEILDVKVPAGDGDSLVPLILGREMPSYACSEVSVPGALTADRRAVLSASGMKLIVGRGGMAAQLFDLEADPGERRNLAGTGHPAEEELAGLVKAVWAPSRQDPRGMVLPPPVQEGDLGSMLDLIERGEEPLVVLKLLGPIGNWWPERAREILLPLLEHDRASVRASALKQLARLGMRGDAPLIRGCLEDEEAVVRGAALRSLATLLGQQAIAFVSLDGARGTGDLVKRAEILAELGDGSGLAEVKRLLPDMTPEGRHQALVSLASHGDEDALCLLEAQHRAGVTSPSEPLGPEASRLILLGLFARDRLYAAEAVARALMGHSISPEEFELSLGFDALAWARLSPSGILAAAGARVPAIRWRALRWLQQRFGVEGANRLVALRDVVRAGQHPGAPQSSKLAAQEAVRALLSAGLEPAGLGLRDPAALSPGLQAPVLTVPLRGLAHLESVPLRCRLSGYVPGSGELLLRASWVSAGGQLLSGPATSVALPFGKEFVASLPLPVLGENPVAGAQLEVRAGASWRRMAGITF